VGRREIEDKLFLDFEPIVVRLGPQLLDVELTAENKTSVLRVTIYRPDMVTLDDCAEVQKALSDRLDETDPISGSYTLELSSPGLERTLRREKEFEIYRGRPCQVNLFAPVGGKRVFQGALAGLERDGSGKESVAVDTDGGRVLLDRANVSKVKLVYDGKADLRADL